MVFVFVFFLHGTNELLAGGDNKNNYAIYKKVHTNYLTSQNIKEFVKHYAKVYTMGKARKR